MISGNLGLLLRQFDVQVLVIKEVGYFNYYQVFCDKSPLAETCCHSHWCKLSQWDWKNNKKK